MADKIMVLKDFVAETISGILEGIKDAEGKTSKKIDISSTVKTNSRHIEFDVAVTVSDRGSAEGGGALRVHVFEAGGKLTSETTNTTVSRVKFGVRIKN